MAQPRKQTREIVDHQQAAQVVDAPGQSRAELARALRDAELARAELDISNRAKDRFLAALSHELRTPLTPIVMAVQVLARCQGLPQSAREALAIIRRNVTIESHLIDDLLDVKGMTRGEFEIDLAPVDLHAAIQGAIELCESEIRGKKQTLTVTLDAATYRTAGDFARLHKAVWKLLANSSKFTPAGGAIWVSSRSQDDRFTLTVSDNGIGIEHSILPTIFDAFAQGDEWVTRQFGGLGLGLAISKATVEAHGGTIHAHSGGRGTGAAFTVELPLTLVR